MGKASLGWRTALLCGSACWAGALHAQTVPNDAPIRAQLDENGVDLASGTFSAPTQGVTIGGAAGGIAHTDEWGQAGWTHSYVMYLSDLGSSLSLIMGSRKLTFTRSGSTITSNQGDGGTLSSDAAAYYYTDRNGNKFLFQRIDTPPPGYIGYVYLSGPAYISAIPVQIEKPDGDVQTIEYEAATADYSYGFVFLRLRPSAVTNRRGYKIAYQYASDNPYTEDFAVLSKSVGINSAVEYCGTYPTCTGSWPSQSYSQTVSFPDAQVTFTNALSQSTTYTLTSGRVTGVKLPSSSANDISVTYDANNRVASVTKAGATWTYSFSLSASTLTATITDPLSHQRTTTADINQGVLLTDTDALGRTVTYQYDGSGRQNSVTFPEGNSTQYTLDSRGNMQGVTFTPKAGSGLSTTSTTASYDATCTYPAKCNKPNTTTDAAGNVTTYAYNNTTGQPTSVTLPAPTTGAVQPQTRYSYTSLYGYYKQAPGGSPAIAPGPISVLTGVSSCSTTASCAGTADETKVTIGYGPQSAGTANNLLPVSATSAAGNGAVSATSVSTYDTVGNVATVDGPLAGTADTTAFRYDALGRPVGTIAPDPDGAGSAPNLATRITYDAKGRVTLAEQGTTAGQSDTAWSGFVTTGSVAATYDNAGRRLTETVKGSNGVAVSLAQSSYDAAGRLDCTTTRMNPSTYGSLPSSACTAATAGSHGPDRIVKVNYDAADQVTSVVTAYGTAAQATDVTRTYTTNGKLASVTDAESNRTSYEYDGLDRLAKVRYPVTTKGSNASSTTDYEQFTYDASGNVLTRRKRDGQTAAFTYDALNRPTLKNLPGSELDVTYSFDLRGRMTGASQTGNALTFGYDALDRRTSAGGPLGTVSYQYDAAGRRTRTTWPDSFYVGYDYRVTGEVTAIRENGAASGLGVLATYGYDAQGRRVSLTRGNGTVTTYGVDTASRLSSLALNLDGATTTNDVTTTFAYSPANQIASQTRTNDGYAWTGHANLARGYTSNGLNQLTVSGNRTLSYDARGNLWKDQLTGTPTSGTEYVFDSENKLATVRTTAASPVTLATLAYDPMLRLYQTATPTPTTARFQYDGTDLIAEYNGSNVLQKRYVHGPGTDEPLVEYAGSGTGSGVRTFLHADERGSIVARSNEAGAKTAIISYDEYGIPANGAGRFLYTGQTWLPEVGIYYYKARVYSPTLGRFLQTDPIGYGDGMNWYNYVGSDPVNRTDPSGLAEDPNGGLIVTAPGWNLDDVTCDGGPVANCFPWRQWWRMSGDLFAGQGGGGGTGTGDPHRGCPLIQSRIRRNIISDGSQLLGPVEYDTENELALLTRYFQGDASAYRMSAEEWSAAVVFVNKYGGRVMGVPKALGFGVTSRSINFGAPGIKDYRLDGLLGSATGYFRNGKLFAIEDTFNFDYKDRGSLTARMGVGIVRSMTCGGDTKIPVTGFAQ